ncbi:MAG: hypothetical protein EOO54_08380 [Haliea sp.]|nr:MAG: hypothetical protein EOO54_08380 [Haliea sp.]
MIIRPDGLYLDRSGHRVGIARDRGHDQVWRWATTGPRPYYVQANGKASMGGPVDRDLVKDISEETATCP